MADPRILSRILQLGKELGANISKSIGTKSNVSFMGPGPKDGMLFQKDINPESFASIGIEKVLPDIETSLGYAVGGKLNDIQLNKLIDNMSMMADMIDPLAPKNVIDLATRTRNLDQEGLASLRLMSDDFGNIAPEEAAKLKELKNIDVPSKALSDTDRSGLMSRLDEIVKKKQTEAAASSLTSQEIADKNIIEQMYRTAGPRNLEDDAGYLAEFIAEDAGKVLDDLPIAEQNKFIERAKNSLRANVSKYKNATPFDEAVEYNARPEDVVQNLVDQKFGVGYFDNVGENTAKRGSAREFLVEALKKENPNQTTFADIVDGADVKAITEGGGGAAGDPIALVDKYFGPRIVEMLPSGASSEEIAIFTERVLTKVRDASGLRPSDPKFDRMTARFVEDFARGGLAKILEV